MIGANNYNQARYTTIGIESQDSDYSFMDGTGGYNFWNYPTNASSFQIFTGNFPNADNNNRGWYSIWFPYGTTDGNNAVGFNNQT